MAFDIASFLAQAANCLEDGETGNIDQLCYCYAQATGTPCPPPESFGAGDRSTVYTAQSFAQLAANGFGLDGTPSVPNAGPPPPSTGSAGPGAPAPAGPGAPAPAPAPAPSPFTGQSFALVVAGAFLFWFILSD